MQWRFLFLIGFLAEMLLAPTVAHAVESAPKTTEAEDPDARYANCEAKVALEKEDYSDAEPITRVRAMPSVLTA